MKIKHDPLPYQSLLDHRSANQIELIVIHCTELPDLSMARDYGERILYPSGTGNSGHYYIDRKGGVQCWVAPEFIAHHVAGHNQNSIGIELVNQGRYPDWFNTLKQSPEEQYPSAQIAALNALIQYLNCTFTNLKHIVGHEDLDQRLTPSSNQPDINVRRKIDPGPLFPWDQIMQNTKLINIGSNAQHKKTT